jgi:hypothetical protein
MDRLAADMRGGVAAFDVRIGMSGSEWVASCGARRIGDSGDGCDDDWHMCEHQDATATDPAMFTPPIIIPPKE